ncbi:MAG: hypothetical protein RLZ92_936 [Pseudomonadota bacterium]
MSVMITELYDALKEAGALEEKSRAAAKALAEYESCFNKIDAGCVFSFIWNRGRSIAQYCF